MCIQTFLNGAVGICLPTHESWIKAYSDDTEMLAISSFVVNLGTISQCSLEASNLNPNYHQALRQLHIKLVDRILYYHKPIAGSASYACLQLVPTAFWNNVFMAFHSNPLRGHLNTVRTFHWIHLQFYWPNMYSFISCMCHICPGCTLPTQPAPNQASSFIVSPLWCRSWCFTLTVTKWVKNQVLKGPPIT